MVPASRFTQSLSYYFLLQVALLEHHPPERSPYVFNDFTNLRVDPLYRSLTSYMGRLVCCTEIYVGPTQIFKKSPTELSGPSNLFN